MPLLRHKPWLGEVFPNRSLLYHLRIRNDHCRGWQAWCYLSSALSAQLLFPPNSLNLKLLHSLSAPLEGARGPRQPFLHFFQSRFQTSFLSSFSFSEVPGANGLTCDILEISLLQEFMSQVLTACSSVINCNKLYCYLESYAAAV